MESLIALVTKEVDGLIKASVNLDTRIRGSIPGEELLIAWHVGEVLYDLRSSELRLAQLTSCRDRAAAIEAFREHCADVLDYIVPHWPLHIRPLRDQVTTHWRPSQTHADRRLGATSTTDGLNALLDAFHLFKTWIEREDVQNGASMCDPIQEFLLDVRSIHELLSSALPLGDTKELARDLLTFCADTEMMLERWTTGASNLRTWLKTETRDSDDDVDEEGGD